MQNEAGTSDFIVRIEGLSLSKDVRNRLAGEMQAVVLRELAKLDTAGDLVAQLPRKEWLGLIASSRAIERQVLHVTAGK